MPIYEYFCKGCQKTSEILVSGSDPAPTCPSCGGAHLEKILSPPAAYSGAHRNQVPGPSDTACCGSSPAAASCAGPGSCCGKNTP